MYLITQTITQYLKDRPSMYIGRKSIYCLRAYLLGMYRFLDPIELEHMSNFQEWVELEYGVTTCQSWADILVFYSSDEQEALELFFKKYEEFLSTLPHPGCL